MNSKCFNSDWDLIQIYLNNTTIQNHLCTWICSFKGDFNETSYRHPKVLNSWIRIIISGMDYEDDVFPSIILVQARLQWNLNLLSSRILSRCTRNWRWSTRLLMSANSGTVWLLRSLTFQYSEDMLCLESFQTIVWWKYLSRLRTSATVLYRVLEYEFNDGWTWNRNEGDSLAESQLKQIESLHTISSDEWITEDLIQHMKVDVC